MKWHFVIAFCLIGLAFLPLRFLSSVSASEADQSHRYPFASLSMEQIRKTDTYTLLRSTLGKDYDVCFRGGFPVSVAGTVAPTGNKPGWSDLVPTVLDPQLQNLKDQILASPVSDSNYQALYALTIFARERRSQLEKDPREVLEFQVRYAEMRLWWALLSELALEIPDGELKKVAVEAVLDCTDIYKQCELAVAFRKSGGTWLDKSTEGKSSLFVDFLVRTTESYLCIEDKTKDPQVKALIRGAFASLEKRSAALGDAAPIPTLPNAAVMKRDASPLPGYETKLEGKNEVCIVNPGSQKVSVGLRDGKQGVDFEVAPGSRASVTVPDGKYQVFFVYEKDPKSLFRGEDFTLKANGIEIELIRVADGNYSIWQVK